MQRLDKRKYNELRNISITPEYLAHPKSSVLIEFGGTKVICAVSIENRVPGWMRAQKVPGGWITSQYSLLPASTHERSRREAARGKQSGRTLEIQRLIGRSLRAVINLEKLGQRTIYLDCDVIDADGGTRCASISGASAALEIALKKIFKGRIPMKEHVAAVSTGIWKGEPILDLCYSEDSNADVDMNIVMTESGKLVEIQGTAEEKTFSRKEMDRMLDLAEKGIQEIVKKQHEAVDSVEIPDKNAGIANLGEALKDVNL